MNFLVLPPEINSARMYTGAGAAPLFMAAAAWDGLASDLRDSAASFGSVVSALTNGPWSGPASVAMADVAAPYVGWLSASAAQAEEAAAQAQAAATAFEVARTATVQPAAVAANRTQLMTLVATNFLGQNTPAIAATEFQYVEMWAQDLAAMVGYHAGAVSVASMLTPFRMPPKSLAGLATRASRLATQAAASDPPAAPPPMTPTLQSLLQALTSGVQALATPASTAISPLMMLMSAATQGGVQGGAGLTGAAGAVPEAGKLVGGVLPDVKPSCGGAGLGGAGVSAGLGQGRLVGSMSVPPSWQGSMPARLASSAMSGLGAAGMPDAAAMTGVAGAPMGGMPMMPMPMGTGGGMPGGMMGRGGASPHVVQNRPSVVPRVGIG
jgi:PPE-repeat protein